MVRALIKAGAGLLYAQECRLQADGRCLSHARLLCTQRRRDNMLACLVDHSPQLNLHNQPRHHHRDPPLHAGDLQASGAVCEPKSGCSLPLWRTLGPPLARVAPRASSAPPGGPPPGLGRPAVARSTQKQLALKARPDVAPGQAAAGRTAPRRQARRPPLARRRLPCVQAPAVHTPHVCMLCLAACVYNAHRPQQRFSGPGTLCLKSAAFPAEQWRYIGHHPPRRHPVLWPPTPPHPNPPHPNPLPAAAPISQIRSHLQSTTAATSTATT
jgi:hypothetical protein